MCADDCEPARYLGGEAEAKRVRCLLSTYIVLIWLGLAAGGLCGLVLIAVGLTEMGLYVLGQVIPVALLDLLIAYVLVYLERAARSAEALSPSAGNALDLSG